MLMRLLNFLGFILFFFADRKGRKFRGTRNKLSAKVSTRKLIKFSSHLRKFSLANHYKIKFQWFSSY